jgi:hypothetical protein
MHLIQILLPLYDNEGQRLPHALHQKVKAELTRRYKGLTAYANTPAEGLWSTGKRTNRDQIVIYEVMTPRKNSAWWKSYRASLEKRFKQQFVVIRAQKIILY